MQDEYSDHGPEPRLRTTSAFLLPFALALALLIAPAGCSHDPVSPPQERQQQAPTLPDPAKLTPNLSFFDAGAQAEKIASKANFFNAYLRVVVIDLLVKYALTPPITAFSLALHTPPSLQPDGSWIWVYTWVNGAETAQIRLRGAPTDNGVDWSLRIDAPDAVPPIHDELWFEGTTSGNGRFGDWTFYDFNLPGKPAVARLAWGADPEGEYLTVTSLNGQNAGDTLSYRHDHPENRLVLHDASTGDEWFIRWNELDGTGSLRVPDYHGGAETCWDEHQNDVECPPAI